MGRRAALTVLGLLCAREAQADDGSDLADMPLEELLQVEVVTASAAPRAVADVPSTVYVFTEETIRRRGYRSLPELLEDVPELQIHWHAAPDFGQLVTVRGIAGQGAEKLIILYDGVRVDGAGASPVSLAHAYSLANVERVEVVLGPVSALYGPDAFTAVVQVRTHDGAALDGGRASMAQGRFGTSEAALVVGAKRGDVAVAVTAATRYSGEPYLPGLYPDDFAWYNERYASRGEVRVAPGASETRQVPIQPWATPTTDRIFTGRLDAGDFHLGLVHVEHGHSSTLPIDPSIGLYTADATWAYSIDAALAQYTVRALDDKLELTTGLSAHRYEIAPRTAFVNVFSQYRPGYKYEHYETTELEARARFTPGEKLSVSLGGTIEGVTGLAETGDLARPFDRDRPAELQDHIYPGSAVVDAENNDLSVEQDFFDMRERALGAFLEVVSRPQRKLTLVAGGRIDHHSRYGGSMSPRLGVIVQPDDATHIKLLYGQAFLAPSPNQTFVHHGAFEPVLDGIGQIVGLRSIFFRLPNPGLRPERVRMGELIVFRTAGPLRLSGSAYLADVRDRFGSGFLTDQQFKGWPVETVLVPINLDERVVTYGGNLGLDGRVRRGAWTLHPTLAYSATGGRRGDDPLPASSAHVVRGAVDVERGAASASLRGVVRSAMRHPETRDAAGELVRIDGSARLDLHLRWNRLLPDRRARTTLWLDVHNLLDARYRTVSNAFDHLPGVPQDPLRLMVGFDAEL